MTKLQPKIKIDTYYHLANLISVSGDTFEFKDQFKDLDGNWNPKLKAWMIPLSSKLKTPTDLISYISKPTYNIKLTTLETPTEYFDVVGDTYEYRNKLRELGGVWINNKKLWRFKDSVIMSVMDFVDEISLIKKLDIEFNLETRFDSKFLFNLFNSAGKTLKYPKIRLLVSCNEKNKRNIEILLKYNPKNTKVILIYNDNKIIGEIYANYIKTTSIIDVVGTIENLAKTPFDELKNFGLVTGRCPFCYKELSKEESVLYGYGPVCARNFGLKPPY